MMRLPRSVETMSCAAAKPLARRTRRLSSSSASFSAASDRRDFRLVLDAVRRERSHTLDTRLYLGDGRLGGFETAVFAGDEESTLAGFGIHERRQHLGELGGCSAGVGG
jgi:hypothetical protein